MKISIRKSSIVLYVIAFSLILFAATTPPAGSVIEEHSSGASSSSIGTYNGSQLKQAQQFYLDENDAQPVTGIGILLKSTDRGSPLGDITLAIYSNQSGNIPGTKITGTEKSFAPQLGVWNYVSFDAEITLNTGSDNKYWIVASIQNQSGDNDAYGWHRSTSNTYARGYRKTFNKSGSSEWSGSQTGDFSFRVYGDASLAVFFSDASAKRDNNRIIIKWTTESEVDVIGFNVLRCDTEQGVFTQKNTSLISAKGSSSSKQHYKFIDNEADENIEYWYRIEEVGLNSTNILCTLKVSRSRQISQNSSSGIISISPNPFNPDIHIKYTVNGPSSSALVYLKIYNLLGQEVRVLISNNNHKTGTFNVRWDGLDKQGMPVQSGMYICGMFINGSIVSSGKMFKVN